MVPPRISKARLLAAALMPCALLALADCASTPPPSAELGAAKALIGQAEGGAAQQYDGADLETARGEYRDAERLQKDQPEQSRRLARQSAVDAQLAIAKAQAEKARQALSQVNAGTDTLRDESVRDAAKGAAEPSTAPPAAPPTMAPSQDPPPAPPP